jgi:hypothetical protein
VGHLPNKARKLEEEQRRKEAEDRLQHGWTIFHFDFKPSLTRRNMTTGEAVRHLMRVTGTRISFWRCPIRGLAIQYRQLPRTPFSYDQGGTWKMTVFSDLEDKTEAKRALVIDMLLRGIELYRGLPNAAFDEEVRRIRWLLKAPPRVSAEQWMAELKKLDSRTKPLLRTHEGELRFHLLGEKHTGPTGTVALTARIRLEGDRGI